MWILILYVGVNLGLNLQPIGGPATAEFASKQACEAALVAFTQSLGAESSLSMRVEMNKQPFPTDPFPLARSWTVKGECVAKN